MSLKINGYTLNPKFQTIKDLMDFLSKHGIIVNTKSQAKSVLHLLRLVGFKHIRHFTSDTLELNVPCKAEPNRVYTVDYQQGLPVVSIWGTVSSTNCVTINDVIEKTSLTTWIQNL